MKFLSLLCVALAAHAVVTAQGIRLFEGVRPVSINKLGAEADYHYFRDTAGMGAGALQNMAGAFGYAADYGVGLSGMPFDMSIRESNGINTMNYTPFRNFYQFNFDHTKYLETLRGKLLEKLSPEAIMNAALARVKGIRTQYEQQLRGEIAHIQSEYAKGYGASVALPADATNLSANDMAALRNRLLPGDALRKYQKSLAIVQAGKRPPADSTYRQAVAEVKRYEAMENVYSKITAYKQRFENNALVKQLLATSKITPGNLQSYLSDPNNLGRVLDDQASLSTMQRLFCNIKTLDLGSNAVRTGDLGLTNLVNNGVNTQYQNKTATLGMVAGRGNNINYWQQAGLTSSVTNEYSNLTGFTIGTGSGSPVDQSIAVNLFHLGGNVGSGVNGGLAGGGNGATAGGGAANYLPLPQRQDGAITVHTGMAFGGVHVISLDVSRSFGAFQNMDSVSGGKGSLFNGAGKANYAGILSYMGELFHTDVKVYLKKVGLGYNNPGNALLRAGESQAGLGLARKFLHQRLSLRYDGDYRRQVFDPNGNFIYTALTNKLQTGFKIDRNDRVTLVYQRSDYRSDFYGKAPASGVNSLLQLNATYRFIAGNKKVNNTLTVSRQQMSIPFTDSAAAYSNTSLLVTHTSAFMVGKNLLTLTLADNQSTSKTYYFNTSMFSAEGGCSYALKAFRLSSTLGYYDNAGWNRQVGIRQQGSAAIGNKLAVDLQVSYKKAIHTIRPELADQLFASTGVRYTFK